MYVVTGATGNTGRVVADTLLQRGRQVTVVVRDEKKAHGWRDKGARIGVANLNDAAAMTKVLTGAEGAYLLVPPQYGTENLLAAQAKVSDALAKAVAASGVPHVVLLSSVGAQQASGTGPIRSLHYAESVIPPASPNTTSLRAAYFFENWAPVLGAAAAQGKLPTFLTPDRKIPMNATEDIGRIAADLLVNPLAGRKVVEMAGPEDYSPADIAQILQKLLNKRIELMPFPLSAVEAAFKPAGFSKDVIDLFAEMYAGINDGTVAYEDSGIEFRRGTVTAEQALGALLKAGETKP